jgi:SulP family sulfate permease
MQQSFLDENGDQLYILKLQGFVFFGTANGLFEQIRERVRQPDQRKVRFILLDFNQVTGLDTTGLLSFAKLLEFTKEHGIALVLTGLRGRAEYQFTKSGFTDKPGILQIFRDLDHGAEWCEEQLLSAVPLKVSQTMQLPEQLHAIWGKPEQVWKLIGYMQRLEIGQGQYLIRQGDDPDFLYMVESGQVTAQVETPGKPPIRLESMGGGRVVGELGFYLGSKRSAAVVADEPSVIYMISHSNLAEVEKLDPETAYVFHRIIVHLMGERILHLIKTVHALQD